MLGQAVTVEWRRIEVTDAGGERRVHAAACRFVGHFRHQIAERRGAKAELRDAQRGLADRAQSLGREAHTPSLRARALARLWT